MHTMKSVLLMRSRFALGIIAGLLLLGPTMHAPSASAQNASVKIPWDLVRRQLPLDKEVLSFPIRRNVWPNNNEPFFRDETFEVAFGHGIRAKKGDRKKEQSLGQGLVAKNGYIRVVGGWRAHLKVKHHNDFFDGTFSGRLYLAAEHGRILTAFQNVHVNWRESAGSKIVKVVTFGQVNIEKRVEERLKTELTREVNKRIAGLINERVNAELAKHPLLRGASRNFSLRVRPDVVVITLHRPPTRAVDIKPPRIEFRPRHTEGDTEFDGHGPRATVRVQFALRNNQVYQRVYLRARETKKDWTTAEGWSSYTPVYSPPEGWKITSIGSRRLWDLVDQELHGHGVTTMKTLLGTVRLWGDRKGQDAGVYTRVRIDYDYLLPIDLEPAPAPPENERIIELRLPRTVTLVPKLTRGDREFDGHGPHVRIQAGFENTGQVVRFAFVMTATETRKDWTTGKGVKRVELYRPPPGWRVEQILGHRQWPRLVDYIDRDHKPQNFKTALGTITVFGDRKGKDIGQYTRMVATLDYPFRLKLVRTSP